MSEVCERWVHLLRLFPGCSEAHCLEDSNMVTARGEGPWKDFRVWGVTPRVAKIAKSLGLEDLFPTLEVIRKANDKCFSHQLEHDLGIALPHSSLVSSLDEFKTAIRDCPHDWVLKHPLGVSGRERMLGRQGVLTPSIEGWARRRLSQGFSLVFEPWVTERSDSSMHFDISRTGDVSFIGSCELLCDSGGVFRGHRVRSGFSPEEFGVKKGREAACILAGLGYWGPVGIDSFTGILGNTKITRPIVELNARCSFGLLALALKAWLPDGFSYLWWHPSCSEAHALTFPGLKLRPLCPSSKSSGLYSLPVVIDPREHSSSVLAVAETEEKLWSLEEQLKTDL